MSFAQGASITLASTAISCSLALTVEQSAHRLFFWVAPHWYARVDQAYGLTNEDLQYAKMAAVNREIRQVGNLAHHIVFMDKSVLFDGSLFPKQPTTAATSTQSWWNHVRPITDEERILESAPL
jgi:hypothetical protein